MTIRTARVCLATVLCLALAIVARGQELLVAPENATGVYQPGQTIRWTIQVKAAQPATSPADTDGLEAAFTLKQGGITPIAKSTARLTDGRGVIEAKLDEPGWLLVDVSVKLAPDKQLKASGGAIVAPEKIQPALPRPDDFDAFWAAKLKDLEAVPANPKLEPADAGRPGIEYARLTMDNLRGSHIRGQIARPKQGEKFPAMLIVQWAGVYPLQRSWVLDRAGEGWLALNILAHDLPIDEPEQFYKDQAAGPLKSYTSIGNDDRETSYFLRMYLSCYRAAQYLAERPDWDGRTLVVTGGSQGGLQALVTAALHPKVTAVLACVPAGCDLNGLQAGRMDGWPKWYGAVKDKDPAKVRQTARYYDVVNFAPRVKCPTLVGLGLIDTTCPAPGVFAACNQLAGPKEVVVLPVAGHQDQRGSHGPYYARFNAWKAALVKGEPAPVK